MRKRLTLFAVGFAACVATPLPQPPGFQLDVELVDAEPSDLTVVFDGAPGALTPGSVDLRITPGPTDSDPILEIGTGPVAADGSFSIVVVSPLENTFFVEALTAQEDVFVAAVAIDAGGTVTEVDPGPDTDEDGSPDAVDCAPDDPNLSGQRCP
jgi:hypothetical protein